MMRLLVPLLLVLQFASCFVRHQRWVSERRSKVMTAAVPSNAELLSRYDGKTIDAYYSSRLAEVVARAIEVGSPLAGWWVLKEWDKLLKPFRSEREIKMAVSARAEDLKDAIVAGRSITFIKSGQALSLRPDLLKSADLVRELSKLQDEVGTFPNDVAYDIMRTELGGRDPDSVYRFDPPTPIASASIGQVYRATLRATNATVAVKVQRPDALQTAPLDMYILRRLAAYVKQRKRLRSNLVAIADEFGAQLWAELNYTQEACNCMKFKELYGGVPGVYVPSVDLKLTTRRLLTMEWVEGVKGPWLRGGEQMLTIGLQCSVLQLLGKGYFHSDPHRGNLLRTEKGELAYIDFGMCCDVPASRRYALIGTVLGLVNKDIPLVIDNLKTLELLPPETDTMAVVGALEGAVLNATQDGSSGSTLNFTSLNQNLESLSSSGLLPFSLPPFYTLIIRTLTILEGLALSVDPSFRLVRGAYPFIAKQILQNPEPEMQALLRAVMITPEGRIRWDKLEQFISISSNADAAVRGDFSALKSAQSRADLVKKYSGAEEARVELTLEVALAVLDFILGEKGAFLREPLLDEVVDTIDALGLTAAGLASFLSSGLLPSPSVKPDRTRVVQFLELLSSLASSASSASSASAAGAAGAGAAGGAGVSGGAGGGSGIAIPEGLGVVGRLAESLVSIVQSADPQQQWARVQPLLERIGQLLQQVAGRLAARGASRAAQAIASPKNIELVLPFVARALELVSPKR